jgi:hypothetical protein
VAHKGFPDVDCLPLGEAIARMVPTLGGSKLAGHWLRELMRSGELESAVRWIAGGFDGQMLIEKLATSSPDQLPPFWETHLLDEDVVRRLDGSDPGYLGAAYFVNRRQFDKLYPPPKAATPTDKSNRPSRRAPPGPEAIKNWKLEVARECVRRAEAQETKLSAPAMVTWCKDSIGHEPNLRDMQKLLKFLYDS